MRKKVKEELIQAYKEALRDGEMRERDAKANIGDVAYEIEHLCELLRGYLAQDNEQVNEMEYPDRIAFMESTTHATLSMITNKANSIKFYINDIDQSNKDARLVLDNLVKNLPR